MVDDLTVVYIVDDVSPPRAPQSQESSVPHNLILASNKCEKLPLLVDSQTERYCTCIGTGTRYSRARKEGRQTGEGENPAGSAKTAGCEAHQTNEHQRPRASLVEGVRTKLCILL